LMGFKKEGEKKHMRTLLDVLGNKDGRNRAEIGVSTSYKTKSPLVHL